MARAGDLGDAPACSVDAEHGRTYATATGSWCPVCMTIFGPAVYNEQTKMFEVGPVTRAGQHVAPRKEPAQDA